MLVEEIAMQNVRQMVKVKVLVESPVLVKVTVGLVDLVEEDPMDLVTI